MAERGQGTNLQAELVYIALADAQCYNGGTALGTANGDSFRPLAS